MVSARIGVAPYKMEVRGSSDQEGSGIQWQRMDRSSLKAQTRETVHAFPSRTSVDKRGWLEYILSEVRQLSLPSVQWSHRQRIQKQRFF